MTAGLRVQGTVLLALEQLPDANRSNVQQATGSYIAQASNPSAAKVNIKH